MTAPLSPAPALTAEEAARVAVFDAAEEPEGWEQRVEAAARAGCQATDSPWPTGSGTWSQHERAYYRAFAAAALSADAALAGKPTPATVAHNHTRFRNDAGPWSPCPVSCPAAGLLR